MSWHCDGQCWLPLAVVAILGLLYLLRSYLQGAKCNSTAQLVDKVVIITGANTGIGKETAIDMAKRGATVIAACRSEDKSLKVVSEIREITKNPNIFFMKLDLTSLKSIRKFASSFIKDYDRLDILINNAGVMMCPYMKTEDGFEMQLGTNHLGHFALTNLLLGHLKKSNPSRIVNLSSSGHRFAISGMNFDDLMSEKSYNSTAAYAQSKLANILFTKELHRKLESADISCFAVHPGVVNTELPRHFKILGVFQPVLGIFMKTPQSGAQTSIYCAVQEGLESQSGMYFSDCKMTDSSKASLDMGAAKKLWELSENLTGVKFPF